MSLTPNLRIFRSSWRLGLIRSGRTVFCNVPLFSVVCVLLFCVAYCIPLTSSSPVSTTTTTITTTTATVQNKQPYDEQLRNLAANDGIEPVDNFKSLDDGGREGDLGKEGYRNLPAVDHGVSSSDDKNQEIQEELLESEDSIDADFNREMEKSDHGKVAQLRSVERRSASRQIRKEPSESAGASETSPLPGDDDDGEIGSHRTSLGPPDLTQPPPLGDVVTNRTEVSSNHSTGSMVSDGQSVTPLPVVDDIDNSSNATDVEMSVVVEEGNSTSYNISATTMNVSLATTEEPTYLDKLSDKFKVFMDNRYMAGIVLPISIGIGCGLVIICVVCCVRRTSRRAIRTKKYKNLKVHENLKGMDEMLLLGESSEDEF